MATHDKEYRLYRINSENSLNKQQKQTLERGKNVLPRVGILYYSKDSVTYDLPPSM